MRQVIFALLVAAPTALITWMITNGVAGSSQSRECLPAAAVSSEASGPTQVATTAQAEQSGNPAPDPPSAFDVNTPTTVQPTPSTPSNPVPTASPSPSTSEKGNAVVSGPPTLRRLLEPTPEGFRAAGGVALYDQQGLFEYIDGAAPVYIERGFRQLAAVELERVGGGEVTCDVYDMSTGEQAASIYVAERPSSGTSVTIGDQGHTSAMSLVFRKGPYYVKLTAFDEQAESTLPQLAKTLAGRIR